MFRSLFLFLLVFMTAEACKSTYKKCNCESNNEELKAYSEILNELVEHSFYNFYLGTDEERIFKEYAKSPLDTIRINREVVRLQNKLFQDTGRFCIIYLDTTGRKFNRMSGYQKDTSDYAMQLRRLMQEVAEFSTSIFDTIGAIQSRYLPQDFTLCTSKIKMLSDNKSDSNVCVIGKVRLSKIFFNPSNDKGIMYYEFVCGGLCGRGNVILIEKINERWSIIKSKMIWIR